MKTEKQYVAPQTQHVEVELENGFMSASIFDATNKQDDGVTITGHEVGNTGDYSGIGWDGDGTTKSTWGY